MGAGGGVSSLPLERVSPGASLHGCPHPTLLVSGHGGADPVPLCQPLHVLPSSKAALAEGIAVSKTQLRAPGGKAGDME